MKTKLKTILGAITLGLCLIPFIIVGIRRSQTNSIIQDKSLSGFITVKPIYSKFLRPAGDIKDFRDYIELVRKNTFIKTIGAEKKQLLQEGIQEDLDLIVDEALPYITRTLSSIGLNRTARPKVSFVDKFLGVYPSTMRNFLSGNYIEGMYNPVYNQLEINAVDSSKLRRNELKETVTHELIHSQYPGLPFFLWYKIPLFADESFVTVATLETLADQALHGDQLAKSRLLITLIKK